MKSISAVVRFFSGGAAMRYVLPVYGRRHILPSQAVRRYVMSLQRRARPAGALTGALTGTGALVGAAR